MIVKVVLGFGSNMGSRLKNIQSAVKMLALSKGFNMLAESSIYETEPWGYKKQNKFLNSCAVFLCRNAPAELLKRIKLTEKKLGRVNRGKWKAREIDIDVLFYGNRIINEGKLVIPHPHLKERNFVLEPLVELMPGFIHPVYKKNISNIHKHSTDNSYTRRVT
jgi:dihydroneopterin aldolase/2-amino-4-hydroxy-6-hydroxymethyldihydropteridine diphosphokinase